MPEEPDINLGCNSLTMQAVSTSAWSVKQNGEFRVDDLVLLSITDHLSRFDGIARITKIVPHLHSDQASSGPRQRHVEVHLRPYYCKRRTIRLCRYENAGFVVGAPSLLERIRNRVADAWLVCTRM